MGKFVDLSGRQFGRLTVIERAGTYRPRHDPFHSQPQYLCRCECGEECIVLVGSLKQGRSRSCGCLRREATGQRSKEMWRNKHEALRCNIP